MQGASLQIGKRQIFQVPCLFAPCPFPTPLLLYRQNPDVPEIIGHRQDIAGQLFYGQQFVRNVQWNASFKTARIPFTGRKKSPVSVYFRKPMSAARMPVKPFVNRKHLVFKSDSVRKIVPAFVAGSAQAKQHHQATEKFHFHSFIVFSR